MTPTDAAKVLAIFATAYSRDLDETAAELWYQSTLRHVDAPLAARVAEQIVATDQWFPTPARFNEIRRGIERAMAEPHKALPSAPVTETERDRVRALIAETRSTLRGPA